MSHPAQGLVRMAVPCQPVLPVITAVELAAVAGLHVSAIRIINIGNVVAMRMRIRPVPSEWETCRWKGRDAHQHQASGEPTENSGGVMPLPILPFVKNRTRAPWSDDVRPARAAYASAGLLLGTEETRAREVRNNVRTGNRQCVPRSGNGGRLLQTACEGQRQACG